MPDNDIGNSNRITTANYKLCQVIWSVYLSCRLSHVRCETLVVERFVGKKRGRIEDTLLEIMAMNIFWRSSRAVFLCKAVREIHFASGWLCPLLTELCCSDSEGAQSWGRAAAHHRTMAVMSVDTPPPFFFFYFVFEVLQPHAVFVLRVWSVEQFHQFSSHVIAVSHFVRGWYFILQSSLWKSKTRRQL